MIFLALSSVLVWFSEVRQTTTIQSHRIALILFTPSFFSRIRIPILLQTTDLYDTVVFLVVVYVAGQFAAKALKMPCLVGEIVAGILLGPPLADFVPNPEAWVLLGEVGLILLVLEAGIDIDVSTLKLIGTRGFLIAFIGSILPIGIGIIVAIAINGTSNIKSSIAAGAVFGPTSLGIALNILRSGNILNTPVGQLIISAAVMYVID